MSPSVGERSEICLGVIHPRLLRTSSPKQFVDVQSQWFIAELFDDGQESDLIQALLASCPEISASSDAVSLEETEEEDATDDFDESGEDEESL
ncbi:hypothetical protein C5Y97_24510 [Blastopirellula marina]|uniref:Uncharacterized protein n=1 Tax=Blastopirellula marina TaxID=124 RepID=A0A2S8F9T0_9BACT|nr:hypothetical protein C5Y98_24495 [Blastopirellula marina]PTL42196.1 hypothetical protein C5Y97_24510 [Blastopirellula marina]